jgi:hypothetical protein
MSDDLRSTLESAVQEHSEPEVAVPSSAPESVAPVEASPATDASPVQAGEAPAETQVERGSPDKPKSIEEVANAVPAEKPVDKAPADPRIDRAPQSWRGESKKVWNELPLNVRQEVVRRERETTRVMQEAAQARHQISGLQEVFAPHMDRINSVYGGDAMTAVTNLLAVERQLFNGTPVAKAQLIANMVKQFGIDIIALDAALAGQPAPEAVQQQSALERMLEQKLAPVQQFIQTQQQREQQVRQQTEQQALITIESMSQDQRFPYFEEVRNDMADLIETRARRGEALSLEDAYAIAVRMNDDTYQASTVRDSSQAATQAALQAHQAAQKAKGASVTVSGNPTGPGTNVGNPSDLRGTILSALGETGSRL